MELRTYDDGPSTGHAPQTAKGGHAQPRPGYMTRAQVDGTSQGGITRGADRSSRTKGGTGDGGLPGRRLDLAALGAHVVVRVGRLLRDDLELDLRQYRARL